MRALTDQGAKVAVNPTRCPVIWSRTRDATIYVISAPQAINLKCGLISAYATPGDVSAASKKHPGSNNPLKLPQGTFLSFIYIFCFLPFYISFFLYVLTHPGFREPAETAVMSRGAPTDYCTFLDSTACSHSYFHRCCSGHIFHSNAATNPGCV